MENIKTTNTQINIQDEDLPITNEELAIKAKTDDDALTKIIENNYKLVLRIAGRYKTPYLEFDDIASEGFIGLINAVKAYEPNKTRFSTFAYFYIEGHIKTAIRKADPLPISSATIKNKKNYELAMDRINNENISDPDEIKKIYQEYSLSQKKIENLKKSEYRDIISFCTQESDDISNFIQAKGLSLEEQMEHICNADILYRAIDEKLNQKEKHIITLLYGLYGKKPITAETVAQQVGKTRQRIVQIRDEALKKLKDYDYTAVNF